MVVNNFFEKFYSFIDDHIETKELGEATYRIETPNLCYMLQHLLQHINIKIAKKT
jgi:hypothetical protein